MAKKKVTRKELLKSPDEFLTFSARAVIFINEHSRQFAYLGVAVVANALIYSGIHNYLRKINKKGQNTYNMAYYTLVRNMSPDANIKDLKQSEELFEQVKDRYGISKAARLALPELAYLKFIEKKYDEAISLYKEFLSKASDDIPYQSLAWIALAACYEAKGDLNSAIEALNRIIAGPDDFFKEQAMLSLSRIYRLSHHEEKSREILKEFVTKYTSSPFLPLAKAHLE